MAKQTKNKKGRKNVCFNRQWDFFSTSQIMWKTAKRKNQQKNRWDNDITTTFPTK
jgi:hypothetical protein